MKIVCSILGSKQARVPYGTFVTCLKTTSRSCEDRRRVIRLPLAPSLLILLAAELAPVALIHWSLKKVIELTLSSPKGSKRHVLWSKFIQLPETEGRELLSVFLTEKWLSKKLGKPCLTLNQTHGSLLTGNSSLHSFLSPSFTSVTTWPLSLLQEGAFSSARTLPQVYFDASNQTKEGLHLRTRWFYMG